MGLVADTTFLVGLWRKQDWAIELASSRPDEELHLPWVVLGEFWHGALKANHDRRLVESFLGLGIHYVDARETMLPYGEICVSLQEQGIYSQVGQNDIWIGAAARALELPIAIRNSRHFLKMPGVRLCE